MGFWSSVGGFISGACEVICGAVCGGLGALGAAIGGITAGLLAITSSPLFAAVVGLINVIAEISGLITEKDKPEEIGVKMEKAKSLGINPENYNSTREYIEAVKNIELEPEDLEKLEDEDGKKVYTALGTGLCMLGINEDIGLDIDWKTYKTFAELGLKGKEVKDILNSFKENEVEPKVDKAIAGELKINETKEVLGTLEAGINKLDNSEVISARLDDMLNSI